MAALISSRDLIEIAIQAETRGAAFYGCLAERMSDAQAREVFARMEREEREHLQELEALLREAHGYPPAEPYPDGYYDYLRALLDHWALPDEAACARVAEDLAESDACPLASTFERQVVLLLHEMRRFVPEDKHHVVQRLLDGEYEHVARLHGLEQGALV